MNKGIRFRLYPNKEQQNLINKTFGCCRLIYNKGLDMRERSYNAGNSVGYNKASAMLTELKSQDDYAFLKKVDAVALQQSLRDLDNAYSRFYKRIGKHPKFRSKRNIQSYRTVNTRNTIRISGKYIRLPKLGYVKFKQSMEVGNIKNATIERTTTGKYFVVLNVEFEPEPKRNNGGLIGIDVGIKHFFTDSNGNTVSNPKYLEKSTKQLHKAQRKLSRMIESHIVGYKSNRCPIYDKPLNECRNIQKQRIKLAKIHEKITNQRNDFLQKESTKLIRENQTIVIEDLKVSNMLKNKRLAKSISDVSWSKFFEMLEYKASWYGNTIIRVDTFYPSSQTCTCCGYKNTKIKNLRIRSWKCPKCKTIHDRDINAAKNILKQGIKQIA